MSMVSAFRIAQLPVELTPLRNANSNPNLSSGLPAVLGRFPLSREVGGLAQPGRSGVTVQLDSKPPNRPAFNKTFNGTAPPTSAATVRPIPELGIRVGAPNPLTQQPSGKPNVDRVDLSIPVRIPIGDGRRNALEVSGKLGVNSAQQVRWGIQAQVTHQLGKIDKGGKGVDGSIQLSVAGYDRNQLNGSSKTGRTDLSANVTAKLKENLSIGVTAGTTVNRAGDKSTREIYGTVEKDIKTANVDAKVGISGGVNANNGAFVNGYVNLNF